MKEDILRFINEFKKNEKQSVLIKTFTEGFCYYFALILNDRFNGEIIYIKDFDHFVFKKEGFLFDITGNVTSKYKNCRIIENWRENKTIVKQCILK